MNEGQPQAKLGLEDFSGLLPMFPLPGVVFFPCTLLPLHIFEPRYRAMIAHASGHEGCIGMVLLKPGWEKEYAGNPPIHEVACLGKMVECSKLPDGRFNIVLCGVKRVRVDAIVSDRPYRTARVEVIEDVSLDGREREAGTLRERLLDVATTIPPDQYRHRNMPGALRKLEAPLGCTADLLADSLLLPAPVKQGLLTELDPIARAVSLLRAIGATPEPSLLVAGRRFPPQPSIN